MSTACVKAFLMDNGLLSIISVGFVQLVKMLMIIELHGLIDYFSFFENGSKNDKEKKYKEKNIM